MAYGNGLSVQTAFGSYFKPILRRCTPAPIARCEDCDEPVQQMHKFLGELWATELFPSPLDVVAKYGNYVPNNYDLRRVNTTGTAGFDHPRPSICTVLKMQAWSNAWPKVLDAGSARDPNRSVTNEVRRGAVPTW